MQVGAAPAAASGKTVGDHVNHFVELHPRHRPIGPGPGKKLIQLLHGPLAAGDFGDHLLRQYVERLVRNDQCLQLTAVHRVQQGHTFD